MSMGLGYFGQQELLAPGAWDHTEPGQHQTNGTADDNAAHKNYSRALAVQERSAARLIMSTCFFDGGQDPIQIVGRTKGRKWVVLKVPTSATVGIWVSHRGEEINANDSWYLDPNDPPLFLPTEATIWGASAVSGTAAQVSVAVGIASDSYQDQ